MTKFSLTSELLLLKGQNHGKLSVYRYPVREFKEFCYIRHLLLYDHPTLDEPAILRDCDWVSQEGKDRFLISAPLGREAGDRVSSSSSIFQGRARGLAVSVIRVKYKAFRMCPQSPRQEVGSGCLVLQSGSLTSHNLDSCNFLKEEN